MDLDKMIDQVAEGVDPSQLLEAGAAALNNRVVVSTVAEVHDEIVSLLARKWKVIDQSMDGPAFGHATLDVPAHQTHNVVDYLTAVGYPAEGSPTNLGVIRIDWDKVVL